MKNHNIVEEIGLDMASNDKNMSDVFSIVPDETIIEKIKQIDDVEQTDRDGRTLLIDAAFYGRKKIAEYLINRNANLNAKDRIGNTPLHAAVQEGNIELIELLLDSGANINEKDFYGNSPIFKTSLRTPHEVFEVLIHYGADPNMKGANGEGMSLVDIYHEYPNILNILVGGNRVN